MKNYEIPFIQELCHQLDFQPIKYFAEKLGVSTKTLSNTIQKLNQVLPDHHLYIESKHGVGIRLTGTKANKAYYLAQIESDEQIEEVQKRTEDILEQLLLHDQVVSVRTLCEQYFVSSTSIVRSLNDIEKQLKPKGLYLDKSAQGTRIKGKEQAIRSAKRDYLFKRCNKTDHVDEYLLQYFDQSLLTIAKEMIDYASAQMGSQIESIYYLQLYLTYVIFLQRIGNGFTMANTTIRPVTTELHKLKTFPVILDLISLLQEKYGYQVDLADIRWVNARFAGVYHESQARHSHQIEDMVKALIHMMSDILAVNLNEDNTLLSGLCHHFIPLITRLKNNFQLANPYLQPIKQQFTALFSVLSIACQGLENRYNVTLNDDEIGFILVHFQAALEKKNLSKRVALIYDCPFSNAQLLQNQLRSCLPAFDSLDTLAKAQIDQATLDNFDLILTTGPLDYQGNVIEIDTVLSEANRLSIAQAVTDDLDTKFHYLNQIIQDKRIFLKQGFKSKEEVIHFALTQLENSHCVTKAFRQSVLEREFIATSEIGHGIAIPHGKDSFVNKTSLVLITLDKPILWKNDYVSVIFLLAISLEQGDVAKLVLKDLYQLIKTPKNIEAISQATTLSDIYTLLYPENN